jgi:NADPH:quinone reductase-like Zn-dependent oxidoreductase
VTYTSDLDVNLARGLAAASQARWTNHVEELLASDEVDVVVISTPHHLHAPLALAAIDAGKHVVVEKPMATNVADCDRMIAAAERRGVRLSVAFVFRYDARVRRARELLVDGVVGAPIASRVVFEQERAREYWSSGLTGRVTSDWRGRKASAGGGVLIMNACHLLDGMSWVLGTPVLEVSACEARFAEVEGVEVEDTVSLTYRYASGALGTPRGHDSFGGAGRARTGRARPPGPLVVGTHVEGLVAPHDSGVRSRSLAHAPDAVGWGARAVLRGVRRCDRAWRCASGHGPGRQVRPGHDQRRLCCSRGATDGSACGARRGGRRSSVLKLRLERRIPLEHGDLVVLLAVAPDGSRRAWYEWASGEAPQMPGELDVEASFALPSDVSTADALRVLEWLPSWELLCRARLEAGSTLLVAGAWPAGSVLELARMLGCAWRSEWGVTGGLAGAIRIPATEQPLAAVRSGRLPARPDAVILTSLNTERLNAGCSVCRDRGTIVIRTRSDEPTLDFGLYPEVHRRGLELAFVEGRPTPDAASAVQLQALIDFERHVRRRA